ncbi:DUF4198 domain-containing protein [Vibrio sp. 10N.222.51.C12]|uniref:DUF4198 domain-containing protein n=1 Tax=unclassified Vibrio TaxID=2614977 RepID=UPI000C855ABC|nr:DUF4198 domain-containing protein [Vibrio sp. 10N.286.48.B7]PMH79763.1 nickel transporter [Vibrio sp. 10N.286.48.B7]
MKNNFIIASALAIATCSPVHAHFQLMYTPMSQLDRPETIDMKFVFAHPMGNGHVMNMGQPEEVFVVYKGSKTDLTNDLNPIKWTGSSNQAKAYELSYKVKRSGDYLFGIVPKPYYEEAEGIYIQQISKRVINRGGLESGWNDSLDMKTEIIPMNKPYQVFAGSTFSGQLLSGGKPAPGVECEVEFINTMVDTQTNSFGKETLRNEPTSAIVVITDDNGMFTFGTPMAGKWGFACLGAGPDTEYEGKELSQDAVLWLEVEDI